MISSRPDPSAHRTTLPPNDATNARHHDLQITRGYEERLPARVREYLTYRVVDRLETVVQHHVIEGLLKPAY